MDHLRKRNRRHVLGLGDLLRVLAVGDLIGDNKDGIRQHAHRQLMQIPVIQNSAPRQYLKGPLLLANGLVHIDMAHCHLQPNQPQADKASPHYEEGQDVKESRPPLDRLG